MPAHTNDERRQAKISSEMEKCLAAIVEHGKLVRFQGGFWTAEGVEWKKKWSNQLQSYTDENDYPVWYYRWGTIEALVKRGRVKITATKAGKYGEFPVEVKLVT